MAGKIVMVTGGARSGKSKFAESICEKIDGQYGYIATAQAFDEGMKDRIKKHQSRRSSAWITYEQPREIHRLLEKAEVSGCDIFLLDCLTVLTTNLMLADSSIDWDTISRDWINELEDNILNQIDKMIEVVQRKGQHLVVVTNEVGLGIVPENRLARVFRDIAGKVNELVAQSAEEVYFVVSGIPMKIKG